MNFFMASINRGIWHVVVNGYTIQTQVVDGKTIVKPFESWSVEELKRVEYDSKAMNIIHPFLNCDEFFRVSTCTTMKEIWNLIQVTHEGTLKVRRARKNYVIQEYETFWMLQGETIGNVQKRFTRIVNHLKDLGKVFEEKELNVKILKSLNKTRQLKVMTISESKDLTSITHVELFKKLREYEMDMTRMAEEEAK